MEIFDVADVLDLFFPGIVAGAGLGTIFWLIGYAVSSIVRLIHKP